MLNNDYLVANIGVDTAENELFRVADSDANSGPESVARAGSMIRGDSGLAPVSLTAGILLC